MNSNIIFKVLLVEDCTRTQKLLEALLKRIHSNLFITFANDGDVALKLLNLNNSINQLYLNKKRAEKIKKCKANSIK